MIHSIDISDKWHKTLTEIFAGQIFLFIFAIHHHSNETGTLIVPACF
jgi:hypothetical protein